MYIPFQSIFLNFQVPSADLSKTFMDIFDIISIDVKCDALPEISQCYNLRGQIQPLMQERKIKEYRVISSIIKKRFPGLIDYKKFHIDRTGTGPQGNIFPVCHQSLTALNG